MKEGKFIAFEGTEGVGKSTQVKLICEHLEKKNIPYILTREPGGCDISEKIRNIILDGNNKTMTDQTEALLYAASRTQHLEEVILPNLAKGKLVICDRYVFSSVAYQGYGRKILDFVMKANSHAFETRIPDLNIFLDLSPEEAFKRKGGADKSDRLETSGDEFFERVYNGFKILEKRDDFVSIDTRGNVEQTFDLIVKALEEKGIL
ncbi:MAG: dTMP kinase [Bacillota bacterium]